MALTLWLGQGTTYNVDQIRNFMSPAIGTAGGLLEPQNGNLGITTNLVYGVLFDAFGADVFPLRLVHILALMLASTAFYALIRGRIGPLVALAPTTVLVFFGSDWGHIGTSLGFTVLTSVAAGLAALLMLEREDRLGDLAACTLVTFSVATFSVGLAFLVGLAVGVLLSENRWRRCWVVLVPLLLYLIWWLWARGNGSSSEEPTLANLLFLPGYVFTSLSAVLASLTGLNYEFANQSPPEIALGPGPALALLALVALAAHSVRRRVAPAVWVGLAIAITYWTLGVLVIGEFRVPTKTRYMYPGAVMVLIVATAAVAGMRLKRPVVIAIFVVGAIGLGANLLLLRNGTAWFRNEYSALAKAQFAMLDLARPYVDPDYDPRFAVRDTVVSTPAASYYAAVDRFGSPAFTASQLTEQPEPIRALADQVLASALGLGLERVAAGSSSGSCRIVSSTEGSATTDLPPGRTILSSASGGSLALSRFAFTPTVKLGTVPPDSAVALTIPDDASATSWRATVQSRGLVKLCASSAT